ncbi:MAG: hypothetical protein IJF66_01515 [Clostridia bacterium]|nr:hypothetical protein [Clostridia bacterium]
MNKKLLFLMVGMIVCLTIIGGALAVSFFNATPENGTVVADSYCKLSLGSSVAASEFQVSKGQPVYYNVICSVSKSQSAEYTAGRLTITVTDAQAKDCANLVIEVYSDAEHTSLVGSVTEAAPLVINDITAQGATYYLVISINNAVSDAGTLANIAGQLSFAFDHVAA